jgi:protein-disulfide isomerase
MIGFQHAGALVVAMIALGAGSAAADEAVLATVGDRAIEAREVEQSLRIQLYELDMEKYRLTRRRLEQVIAEELLGRAAAAAGKSVSAYVTDQIQEQLATVSESEVEARYQQAREQMAANGQGPLSGDNSIDEQRAKKQIKNLLLRERASQGVQKLLERLSAETKVALQIRPPDPPVFNLPGGNDPALGPAAAPVTIVEYGDFECPICKESVPILKQLRTLYPGQVRFVYRDFPLASHPHARPAAEAAQCAFEQGAFWPYHDALFAEAPELKSLEHLKLAQQLRLNAEEFADCLTSDRPKAAVTKDLTEAQRLGINATPTFFVNGRYMGGYQTLEALREMVDRALAAQQLQAHPPTEPAPTKRIQIVPLVNPVSERGAMGLFNRVVTARGADIDPGRTGLHMVKPIDVTDTFPSSAPEVYVVIELKQSAFDMFRMIARFILEDPSGEPVGTLLHTDRAHFEFSDTGGFLMMKQPRGGFPAGNYRVELHYGEEVNDLSLLTLVRFKVVPDRPFQPSSQP